MEERVDNSPCVGIVLWGVLLFGASLVVIVPMWRVLGRLGFPPFFAMAWVFPVLGVALLWFVAFSEWPAEDREEA